jgi:FixJ family two-component response regulator
MCSLSRATPVVVMTGWGPVDLAIEAIAAYTGGAFQDGATLIVLAAR